MLKNCVIVRLEPGDAFFDRSFAAALPPIENRFSLFAETVRKRRRLGASEARPSSEPAGAVSRGRTLRADLSDPPFPDCDEEMFERYAADFAADADLDPGDTEDVFGHLAEDVWGP